MSRTDCSDQFRKVIRYKRIGYDLNVMRQTVCLVIKQNTVDIILLNSFNCTPVDRGSDSMMASA